MSEPTATFPASPATTAAAPAAPSTTAAPAAPVSVTPQAAPSTTAGPSAPASVTPAGYTYTGDDERYYPDPPFIVTVQPGAVLLGIDAPPADGRWRPATATEITAAEGVK